MIISFSGRKGSGKTVLRKECEKHGFKRISWADRLKELVAELYGWTIEELNDPIGKEEILPEPVYYVSSTAEHLASLIGADELLDESRVFHRRRDALQYIGTDVLRSFDSEFHVKSLVDRIDLDCNYVLDDSRFCNELQTLRKLNAHCVYVVRPYQFEYSNHQSEIDLLRHHFHEIDFVMNDKDIDSLAQQAERFMSPSPQFYEDFDESALPMVHQDSLLKVNEESAYWAGVIAKGISYDELPLITITAPSKLILKFDDFLSDYSSDVSVNSGFKRMPVSYNYRNDSKLLIDDLKLWDICPKYKQTVPQIIEKDEKLVERWKAGFNFAP